VVEGLDPGELEGQEGVLAGIEVDAVDAAGSLQGVVEGIAARRGDDQHFVFGAQFKGDPVEPGVFPAGVVDEVVAMHHLEPEVPKAIAKAELVRAGLGGREARMTPVSTRFNG
jgi:hypothetical protein